MEIYVAIAVIFHGLSCWYFRGEKGKGGAVIVTGHQEVGAGSQ